MPKKKSSSTSIEDKIKKIESDRKLDSAAKEKLIKQEKTLEMRDRYVADLVESAKKTNNVITTAEVSDYLADLKLTVEDIEASYDMLEKEGAEVILPDFMGFVKFIATHKITFNQLLKIDKAKATIFKAAIKLIDIFEKDLKIALSESNKGYLPPCDIWHLEDKVKGILSIGNQTGEGWFLTAEMIEYIEHGIPNIVCVQPFACLPNHIVGKGVIKTIREKYPYANISPIDYDPGASEANQTNRIKLLMAVAKDNLEKNNK